MKSRLRRAGILLSHHGFSLLTAPVLVEGRPNPSVEPISRVWSIARFFKDHRFVLQKRRKSKRHQSNKRSAKNWNSFPIYRAFCTCRWFRDLRIWIFYKSLDEGAFVVPNLTNLVLIVITLGEKRTSIPARRYRSSRIL